MGTTATVALVCADGKVISTSVNYDGYLRGVGKMLLEHYYTPDAIELMLAGGQMSVLGASCEGAKGHSWKSPVAGQTIYYGRDRGEAGVEPELYSDVWMWEMTVEHEEYTYLFRDGRWEYRTVRSGVWKRLTDAVDLTSA